MVGFDPHVHQCSLCGSPSPIYDRCNACRQGIDPSKPPSWETKRGGGPLSAWMESYNRSLDAEQEKKLQRLDPRGVKLEDERKARGLCIKCGDEPSTKGSDKGEACRNLARSRPPALSYRERRERGLCTACPRPSPKHARCDACREQYNRRPSRQREYRERKGGA